MPAAQEESFDDNLTYLMDHFKQPHEDLLQNMKHNLEQDLAHLSPSKKNAKHSLKDSRYLVENVLKSMDESPLRQKANMNRGNRYSSSVERDSRSHA
jgi:hypothetical protein